MSREHICTNTDEQVLVNVQIPNGINHGSAQNDNPNNKYETQFHIKDISS